MPDPTPSTPDLPLDAATLDRLAERRPWLYTLNDAAFDGLIIQARAALVLRDEVGRLRALLAEGRDLLGEWLPTLAWVSRDEAAAAWIKRAAGEGQGEV